MAHIIFIAGMHRSGTSAVAGELAAAGVNPGANLLPANEHNPKGYFEDQRVLAINDKVLASVGSIWSDPAPLATSWQTTQAALDATAELADYLASALPHDGVHLVKDPRLSRTIALAIEACVMAGHEWSVVAPIRRPLHVAASLWNRNQIPETHALQLWLRYYIDLLSVVPPERLTWVNFEAWTRDPATALRRLQSNLGLAGSSSSPTFFEAKLLRQRGIVTSASQTAREVQACFADFERAGVLSLMTLEDLYKRLGGDAIALERRHYAVSMSILTTVVQELRIERALTGELGSELADLRQRLALYESSAVNDGTLDRNADDVTTDAGQYDPSIDDDGDGASRRSLLEEIPTRSDDTATTAGQAIEPAVRSEQGNAEFASPDADIVEHHSAQRARRAVGT